MRISVVLLIAAVPLLGCGPSESSFDPEDPQVVAEIESQLQSAMAGAAAADADRVLASAGGEGELTFITGDVLLSGLDTIRASFEDTYANIAKQDQTIREKRVRLLSPDVAVLAAVLPDEHDRQADPDRLRRPARLVGVGPLSHGATP
jgi:uncharacterized protein (TIGR02246 family)